MPAFDAAYGPAPTNVVIVVPEEVLTMLPLPWARMTGISYFRQSQTPFRFVVRMRSQASSVKSASGAMGDAMPALLKAQSSRPWRLTTVSTIARTLAASLTSVCR